MTTDATCRFGSLDIAYSGEILAPRAWTTMQSEWAAELAADQGPGPLLELCAGAGQIGLLAARLSGRALVQVEANATAARYAARNAEVAGIAVDLRNARIDEALRTDERFAVIIADPPYLPSRDIGEFPDDPVSAIDGGADGLDVVRDCLRAVEAHLAVDGCALFQLKGEAQAEEVRRLITTAALALTADEVRSHDADRAVMLLQRSVSDD